MAKTKTWDDYEQTDITYVVNTLGEKLLVVDRKTFEIKTTTTVLRDVEGIGKKYEDLVLLMYNLPDSAWERVTGLPLDVDRVDDGHPPPVLPYAETLDGEPLETQGTRRTLEGTQDVQPEDLLEGTGFDTQHLKKYITKPDDLPDFSEPGATDEDPKDAK
jgi:hypothetical protein